MSSVATTRKLFDFPFLSMSSSTVEGRTPSEQNIVRRVCRILMVFVKPFPPPRGPRAATHASAVLLHMDHHGEPSSVSLLVTSAPERVGKQGSKLADGTHLCPIPCAVAYSFVRTSSNSVLFQSLLLPTSPVTPRSVSAEG